MKRPWYLVPAALAILTWGCASAGKPAPAGRAGAQGPETSARADLKTKLDDIIRNKVEESELVNRLDTFALESYDIQDPGTFWGHRAVAGAGGSYDARFFPRSGPDYELTTGRVQVDGNPIDEEVVVLVNKKWSGSHSTDILAAFRPNAESGKMEKLVYNSIIIYREE